MSMVNWNKVRCGNNPEEKDRQRNFTMRFYITFVSCSMYGAVE